MYNLFNATALDWGCNVMKRVMDPEKFASAFVSSPNAPKAENSDSSIEHYLDLYISAFERAVKYNESIIEEANKNESEQLSKKLDILNQLKF